MDEALAAQPIEEPCTPHSGFRYMRFSFWYFAVLVTEMAKLGPGRPSANQQLNPTSGQLPVQKTNRCVLLRNGGDPVPGWQICPSDFYAKHIEE